MNHTNKTTARFGDVAALEQHKKLFSKLCRSGMLSQAESVADREQAGSAEPIRLIAPSNPESRLKDVIPRPTGSREEAFTFWIVRESIAPRPQLATQQQSSPSFMSLAVATISAWLRRLFGCNKNLKLRKRY